MNTENTCSSKHQHEPEIPAILDKDGRCLVCCSAYAMGEMAKEIIALRREISLIDEAFARRPALSGCNTRYDKAMRACAAGVELDCVKSIASSKIEGKTLRAYLEEQFPATIGHIPLQMFCEQLESLTK